MYWFSAQQKSIRLLSVVQLTWFGDFALATNGRIQATQMRQRRGIPTNNRPGKSTKVQSIATTPQQPNSRLRQPIQHLRDARFHTGRALFLRAPVAGGQRVLQSVGDDVGLHRLRQVELFAVVDLGKSAKNHYKVEKQAFRMVEKS